MGQVDHAPGRGRRPGRGQAAPTSWVGGTNACGTVGRHGQGRAEELLSKSEKDPVNCAVGMGDSEKTQSGIILLEWVKSLENQLPDLIKGRFGTVIVDTDNDAALVEERLRSSA